MGRASTTGRDALTGREFELPPGWREVDDRTFERADGARVWRDQRIDTIQPVWWRAQDSSGLRHRGRGGMIRGYRGPDRAMLAVERNDPWDPEAG